MRRVWIAVEVFVVVALVVNWVINWRWRRPGTVVEEGCPTDMTLLKAPPPTTNVGSKTLYFCPMHPEVISDKPGT